MHNRKQELTMINHNAAGIDISSREHYVCVPADRDKKNVQRFGAFTRDLNNLAVWLKECGVTTIAMESTGIYWIPVFQILETSGFEIILVNARQIKNVPGCKTDVKDCEWIQRVHSYGLLSGSFRPNDQTCKLRALVRQRDRLIKSGTIHINRMQKALNEMNIQLHHVISDITGVTGMSIIKAIIDGERDAQKLAEFTNHHIKSDVNTIVKAIEGDYREEHLFVLKQELESYEFYLTKIKECDETIESCFKEFDKSGDGELKNKKPTKTKNAPDFDLKQSLYDTTGIELTIVLGLGELSIQTIISEVGLDMSKWKSEKHFTSWLGLSPNNKITGGKVFNTRTRKVNNKASNVFRMAALNLARGRSALAGFYRRIRGRAGAPKAITETARKLACMFYRLLKYGQNYVEQGIEAYEKKYNETMVKSLKKHAAKLGFDVVKIELVSSPVS